MAVLKENHLNLRDSAKNTAILIEETIQAVENGTHIVNMTAKTMLDVVQSSDRVKSIIEEIAHESEKQAEAVNQVHIGIDQISSVVQNNAAISEQSAASSEELVAQAQTLQSRVAEFKLSGENKKTKVLEYIPINTDINIFDDIINIDNNGKY